VERQISFRHVRIIASGIFVSFAVATQVCAQQGDWEHPTPVCVENCGSGSSSSSHASGGGSHADPRVVSAVQVDRQGIEETDLGRAEYDQGDYLEAESHDEQALAYYLRALEIYPWHDKEQDLYVMDVALGLSRLGDDELALGRYDQAFKHFRRAIGNTVRKDRLLPHYYYGAALAVYKQGDYESALELLRTGLKYARGDDRKELEADIAKVENKIAKQEQAAQEAERAKQKTEQEHQVAQRQAALKQQAEESVRQHLTSTLDQSTARESQASAEQQKQFRAAANSAFAEVAESAQEQSSSPIAAIGFASDNNGPAARVGGGTAMGQLRGIAVTSAQGQAVAAQKDDSILCPSCTKSSELARQGFDSPGLEFKDNADSPGLSTDTNAWPSAILKNPEIIRLMNEEKVALDRQKTISAQIADIRKQEDANAGNVPELQVKEAELKQESSQAEYTATLAHKKMVSFAVTLITQDKVSGSNTIETKQ
jgi:tetratricopeptide (TPR) repeat protein